MKKHRRIHRKSNAVRVRHADHEPVWIRFTVATIVYAMVFAFTMKLIENVQQTPQVASGPATEDVLGAQSNLDQSSFEDLNSRLDAIGL